MNLAFLQNRIAHGEFIERFGWMLVHSVWQFAIIALAAAVARALTRRHSSSLRYKVMLTLFVVMIVAPLATWMLLPQSVSNSRELAASPPPAAIAARSRESTQVTEKTPAISANPDADKPASPEVFTKPDTVSPSIEPKIARGGVAPSIGDLLQPWLGMLVITWCMGVAAFAMRPLVGWLAVRRLRTVGVSAAPEKIEQSLRRLISQMRMNRGVQLLESTLIQTPVVIGYFRPMILLPVSIISNMPLTQLETILTHELAHVRRHDYLVNLLQTLCETLFFYHPAIWWLSNCIRIEREHCCDDAALAFGGDKIEYGRALLSLEELRGRAAALAIGARDGSLVARVRRMLYGEPRLPMYGDRGVWLGCLATIGLVIGSVFINGGPRSLASPIASQVAQPPRYDKGGEASGGLQLRVISVAAKTDEQKPSMDAPIVTAFETQGDITLVAELKNVSDKPIKLVGVRYGDGISAPSIGKSNTRRFGPILFKYEFRGKSGKPIEQPLLTSQGNPFLELSAARVDTIGPGESLVCALKPLEQRNDAVHWLTAGEYTMQVSYVGVDESTQAEMTKHWPKMGFSGLWSGKADSNVIPITVKEQPKLELTWGPLTKGLQAAIELRDGDTYRAAGAPVAPRNEFPLGAAVSSHVHVKNVSDKTITFWSEEFRQGDSIAVTDSAGKVMHPPVPFFSGWPIMQKWTLKPGEVATLYSNIGSGMLASVKTRGRGGPTLSSEAISKAGKYKVQIELNFGSLQTKDSKGNPIPGPEDFSGTIATGETPFSIRERTLFDDPPKFTARISLRSKTGEPVRGGHAEIREVAGEELFNGRFEADSIELKNIEGKPVYVSVRASGFEEQTFYDVTPEEKAPANLELTKAAATKLRLVTADGKPVAGAKVRYFVRSKALAGGGPYPMKGIDGDVWATSDKDGRVALDTLQKFDPIDNKLGDNIYWFYIEPPTGLSGRFIGPFKAGDNLGDVKIGKPITVRGEIRGTAAELDGFSAEWDQPEQIVRGDGSKGWDYAVSRHLEVHRDGDKMTFEITDLRPGRLRFVSNFKGGAGGGHEFSKRIVGPDDVVSELEITESRSDVVLTSKKPDK
jgi:beta-lactamase regulating signal transducer with metallopeptidase domain